MTFLEVYYMCRNSLTFKDLGGQVVKIVDFCSKAWETFSPNG